VALIARHGKLGYLHAAGAMDLARGTPMRSDAVFRIYSMTKPVVTAATLRLAEQGKLRLDDPVSKYLPGFTRATVFAGGSAAAPRTRPAARPMTIRHLLTHTAGFTYGFFGNTPVDSIVLAANPLSDELTLEQGIDSLARLPLLADPGRRWEYSVSIDVLGRVLEVAGSLPLDRLLAREIFEPLGMRETSFKRSPSTEARIPVLYGMGRDGRLEDQSASADVSYGPAGRMLSGGGGLLSTAADYLRFAQMILNGGVFEGRRVLSAESIAAMTTNQLPPPLVPLRDPIVGHAGYGHGLGGVVLLDPAADSLPGERGIYRWWGYAGTFFWIDAKADLVAMIWTQFMPGRANDLERDFQRLVYAAVE